MCDYRRSCDNTDNYLVRVTLRLAVYSQPVRLGDKSLETHDQQFHFPTEHLRLEPLCNILLDERMGLSLQLLLVLASAVILMSQSRWTHDHILLSHIRGSTNLEGQVYVLISLSNRVAQL
jgi:hypothetical protein